MVAPQFPMLGSNAPDELKFTVDQWLQVTDCAIQLVGEDHVIFGTDLDGGPTPLRSGILATRYAMTSHSSQGMTVDRVLIHVDTSDSRLRGLVDKTLSSVATSRARHDAQIFTDDAAQLSRALNRDNAKDTALSAAQIQHYRAAAEAQYAIS